MPKNKKPRKKKYCAIRKVYRDYVPGWVERIFDQIRGLETRILLHLHKGELSYRDMKLAFHFLFAAQFILVRRNEQFEASYASEWFDTFDKATTVVRHTLMRAKEREVDVVVCTGDELKTLTEVFPTLFDFYRDLIELAPTITGNDIDAAGLLFDEAFDAGMNGVHINPQICQRYYDRVVKSVLRWQKQNTYDVEEGNHA